MLVVRKIPFKQNAGNLETWRTHVFPKNHLRRFCSAMKASKGKSYQLIIEIKVYWWISGKELACQFRRHCPAFLRNSNGRLDLPGPTQEASLIPRRNSRIPPQLEKNHRSEERRV